MPPIREFLLLFIFVFSAVKVEAKDGDFKFGIPQNVISGLNGADAKITTEAIFSQAVFRGLNFEALLFEDQEKFLNSIRNQELAGSVIRSVDFLALRDEGVNLQGNNLTITGGTTPLVQYVLLAKKQPGKKRGLKDFEGKRLVFGHRSGNLVDQIWLEVALAKAGLSNSDQVFASKEFLQETSKALVPLFFGKTDISLVRRHSWELMSELNPQMGTHLEIIAESPMLLETLMCLNPEIVPTPDQEAFGANLSRMHLTPKGKSLLTITKVKRFVRFEEKYLTTVRQLIVDYKALAGSHELTQTGRGE